MKLKNLLNYYNFDKSTEIIIKYSNDINCDIWFENRTKVYILMELEIFLESFVCYFEIKNNTLFVCVTKEKPI